MDSLVGLEFTDSKHNASSALGLGGDHGGKLSLRILRAKWNVNRTSKYPPTAGL